MAGNSNSVDELMRGVVERVEKAIQDKWAAIIEEEFKHGTAPEGMKGGLNNIVRVQPTDD